MDDKPNSTGKTQPPLDSAAVESAVDPREALVNPMPDATATPQAVSSESSSVQPPSVPDLKEPEALLAGLNRSGERVQTLWFTFLTVTLYLAVTTGTTTHRMLLLEEGLPIGQQHPPQTLATKSRKIIHAVSGSRRNLPFPAARSASNLGHLMRLRDLPDSR